MSILKTRSWADDVDNSEEEVQTLLFVPAAASPVVLINSNKERKSVIRTTINKPDIPTDLRERLVFIVGTEGFTNESLISHMKANNCNPILLWCLPDRDPQVGLRPFAHAVFKTKEEADELITRKKIITNVNSSNNFELDFRVFEPFETRKEQNPREAKVIGDTNETELRAAIQFLDEPMKIRRLKLGKNIVHILKFSSNFGTSIAIRRLNHYKTVRGTTITAEFGKIINV